MVNSLKLSTRSTESETGPLEAPRFYEKSDQARTIASLYQVLLDLPKYHAGNPGVNRFLNVGCEIFGTDFGFLLRRLSQEVAEVVAVSDINDIDSDEEPFYIGQHLTIENTVVAEIFDNEQPCLFTKSPNVGVYSCGFAYNSADVNTFFGALAAPSNAEPMVVCFISSVAKDVDPGKEDSETLGLLAEGVACMIDLQKSQAQRKMTDQAMLALGSVKTFDEYVKQASLPDVYGVPARVVDVLKVRIGHAPLSIGHVAEEMNLSKRTLQRRLQQQDISFAELRDKVRFHYSIDYLIKQHLSIDSISASLDFSDRTSFTNAFKRWTGLSPSTFRKLFRDYV